MQKEQREQKERKASTARSLSSTLPASWNFLFSRPRSDDIKRVTMIDTKSIKASCSRIMDHNIASVSYRKRVTKKHVMPGSQVYTVPVLPDAVTTVRN